MVKKTTMMISSHSIGATAESPKDTEQDQSQDSVASDDVYVQPILSGKVGDPEGRDEAPVESAYDGVPHSESDSVCSQGVLGTQRIPHGAEPALGFDIETLRPAREWGFNQILIKLRCGRPKGRTPAHQDDPLSLVRTLISRARGERYDSIGVQLVFDVANAIQSIILSPNHTALA